MHRRRAEQNAQNYRERVARVVARIEAEPMASHRLDDLARLANFSPYHFHRVYKGVAGETMAATVRRVRLALAARLLEEGRQSITQVALTVGYDSPQAFTRAFGEFMGQSPSTFQRHLRRFAAGAEARRTGGDTDADTDTDIQAGTPSAVRIVERPAQRVHALRHHGPLSTIPHTQRRLYLQGGANGASVWLGLSCGDPDDAADGFRYYAAAVWSDPPHDLDAEFELLDIPAGRYARHRLTGPYARIDAAMTALYARWLPGSGYEPDDRPALEHYLNSPRDTAQAALLTDLLIPVRTARAP